MSLVDVYHAEHKARLVRLGGVVDPVRVELDRPEPPIAPVVPVSAWQYYPQMWFWELVNFTPRFPNRSIAFYPGAPRVERIQKLVCGSYHITLNDIKSARRTAQVVRARQIAMFLTKEMTPRSLPDIGRHFGGRDHTTVLHAVRKIARLAAADSVLAAEIEDFKAEILA